MKWIKASERLPEDWRKVLVREIGSVHSFAPMYKLSHKNDLLILDAIGAPIKDFPLKFVEWLDESEEETCKFCGSAKVSIRGKYPNEPDRVICPTCAQERLELVLEAPEKLKGSMESSIKSNK